MFLMETRCSHERMELLHVKLGYEGKLVVDSMGRSGGDFNEIMSDSEKLGGLRKNWRFLTDFREAAADYDLEDMGFVGPKYTWSNKRVGSAAISERLDRSLNNSAWRNLFPNFMVRHLNFWKLDHRPLMLEFSDQTLMQNSGRTRKGNHFFFEECWRDDGECKQIIKAAWWRDFGIRGGMGYVLGKLNACGRNLDSWNRKKCDNMRKDIKEKCLALTVANRDRAVGFMFWRQIGVLEERLDSALEVKERYWRQRAKVDWLQKRDKNSRFFHSKASAQKARNNIRGLYDMGGQWRVSKNDLVSVITQYFERLITSSSPSQQEINNIIMDVHPSLPSQMSRHLDSPFTGEDIRITVFDMNPLKAPGKDGLPAVFYQKLWGITGLSVISACLKVLNEGGSVMNLNITVLTLIPKVKNPTSMADYRPISLCNVIYKIIAKAITNRLRGKNKRQLFSNIVDRVWSKIKGWGEIFLSIGGKEILVKAVVQSIPTYAMGLFRLPKSLIAEIQLLSARFWWGGNENKRKIHWCTWKQLCQQKTDVGLGFRDLEVFNRSLLAKQGILEKGLRWRVGKGDSIRIYKDQWVPRPYTFKILSPPSLGIDATVDCLVSPSGGWDMRHLQQNFLDCDVNAMLEIPLGAGVTNDTIVWHFEGSGAYSVKSGYCKISCFDVVWWSRNFVAECQSHVSIKKPNLMVANGIAPCWRPPMAGSYKINCSAVTKVGNHRVGIGIVIRNDFGLVMSSCSQVIEASFDGQVAGIMAVYRGILFSKDCGLEPCVMVSDKVGAVGRILKANPLDSKCGAILVEIANMLALCNGMTITAIPNLANRVAQGLATHALNITGVAFWMEDLPGCIRCLLEADMPT
ncbi:hypothetical protein Dsin_018674 [Dipteronia sinensis]|uniref:RNase H type-1 domain-containing protein n=1 Tax=Dipteronia sinensis TaxID=43782 RepID=A0AAE0E249_9ROSI|nr:hypothetical protein Dsin_018674 [Dipteronia sinensis]